MGWGGVRMGHGVVWCGAVWSGVEWRGMAWRGVAWRGELRGDRVTWDGT